MIGRQFSVDAAADSFGLTARCKRFYSPANSFLSVTRLQPGDCLWVNAPFRSLASWVRQYRVLKAADPSISACFVVPDRGGDSADDSDLQSLRATARVLTTYAPQHPLFRAHDRSVKGVAWPVSVLYDPPATVIPTPRLKQASPASHADPRFERMNIDDTDHSSMTFRARVAGSEACVLLDTGATHTFMDDAFRRRLGLRLQSSPFRSVFFADASSSPLLGQCTFTVRLGGLVTEATALVMRDMSQMHDVIFGTPFLKRHGAVLDLGAQTASFGCGRRGRVLVRSTAPLRGDETDIPWQNAELDTRCFTACADRVEVLSAKEALQALRRGEHFWAAYLTAQDAAAVPQPPGPALHAYAHGEVKPGPISEADLSALLRDFDDMMQPIPDGLPPPRETHHLIPMVDPKAKPVARPVYRMTPKEHEEALKQITDLLKKGWIRPSQSPWAAPVLFAPKPDGNLRMCIDYRGLNRLTVQNAYPMPRIDVLLDRLRGSKVFSSIDLQAGYHQIRIDDADVPKTAFRCPIGHFEYTVMPFGLTNAPATFQHLMNKVFKPLIDKGVVTVYLDDILIHSRSGEEHLQHIREVLTLLREHKLYAKASKCEWNRTEVTFLGHLVGTDGVRMDPKKVSVIVDWEQPKTQAELRSFLGLANYFRKFILGYAHLAAPLNALLKKSVSPVFGAAWGPEHTASFDAIKDMIAKDVILQYPDMNKTFEVISDASIMGTGAVLLQDGRPVAFTSKKLSSAEKNYTTGEQELLGVIHALNEWRWALEGPVVTMVTDHHPLTFLQSQPNLSRRQARWLEFLQRFHLQWEYRPGRTNVADPLSRNPGLKRLWATAFLRALTRSHALNPLRDRLVKATRADPWFDDADNVKDMTRTDEGLWQIQLPTPGTTKQHSALVVPSDAALRDDIVRMHHDSPLAGHMGRTRTLNLIQRGYWWPNMRADVEAYVARCDSCQRNKAQSGKTPGEMRPLPIPARLWGSVGIDFIVALPMTKSGKNAIAVFVDRLSKMVHLHATSNSVSSRELAEMFISSVVRLHGVPDDTVSDRGPQLTSAFWKCVTERLGVAAKHSSAFHPQTDGQTERANRVVSETLRNYCDAYSDSWDEHLPLVEFAMNNAVSASTGQTPFYMNYGFHPTLPMSVPSDIANPAANETVEALTARLDRAKRCLQSAQARMKKAYDAKRKPVTFEVGTPVLLSTKNIRAKLPSKLLPKWIGPYPVTEVINSQAYRLQLPASMRIHDVFHVSLLKKYESTGKTNPPPIDWADDGGAYWSVEKILAHKQVKGGRTPKYEYYVRWKGYGPDHDQWIPPQNFSEDSMIKEYWAELKERAD